jgi:hypothetical protein
MRKTHALTAVLTALTLAGCGNGGSTASPQPPGSAAAEPSAVTVSPSSGGRTGGNGDAFCQAAIDSQRKTVIAVRALLPAAPPDEVKAGFDEILAIQTSLQKAAPDQLKDDYDAVIADWRKVRDIVERSGWSGKVANEQAVAKLTSEEAWQAIGPVVQYLHDTGCPGY